MAELLVMLPVGRVSLTLGVDFDGWRACAGMVLLIGVLLSSFLLAMERAVVAALVAWGVGAVWRLNLPFRHIKED